MKVKDLRLFVDELPSSLDECELILQTDQEGNGYHLVRGIDPDCVCKNLKDLYDGIYSLSNSAEDNCLEEDEWEKLKSNPKKRVLVIFP